MIVIDKEIVQDERRTDVEGFGDFGAGGCGLMLSSVKENNLGQWSCSLVMTGGKALSCNVDVVGEAD